MDPLTILPDREEMAQRLAGLSEELRPIQKALQKYAGNEVNSMGVVVAVETAAYDTLPKAKLGDWSMIWSVVDCLLDEGPVKAAVREHWEQVDEQVQNMAKE